MAEKYHLTSKLPMLYKSMARVYKLKGDLNNYSIAVEKQIAWKDSIYNANSAEAIAELDAKYQLQKKENTIILQQLELVKRNYILIGTVIFIVVISIAAFMLFRSYRKRQQLKLDRLIEEEKMMAIKAIKDAEENERKRIAADLHDNLGAYAASIAYNLENVAELSQGSSIAMEELRNNSQAMVSELSDTIWALKKDALLLTAISDRIKIFIQRIQGTYPHINMDVFEEIGNDVLLPPSQAFHLLRIVQEAVNNAVKHSGCAQLTVTIRSNDTWMIIIGDNGSGIFSTQDIREGNGLINMKNRAETSGWKIQWRSVPGKGTDVIISPTTN